MGRTVWSVCGMCTVRCPIRVEVEDNEVKWIEGNPYLLGGSLCARGGAGVALLNDCERPQTPMIRSGPRGSGKWEQVSWEKAIQYVAEKLEKIIARYGARSVVVSTRGGPWQDLFKAFTFALGSPNYTNHDSACGRNVHHASLSVYGLGRKGFDLDIRNTEHLVLFGRNILSSLGVAEVNQVMDMLDRGGRLTYVDVRQTLTGIKAHRFWLVRPGTDYALLLGIINEVLRQGAYDKEFVDRYTEGFEELAAFVEPYTAEWAARECGIRPAEIKKFVEEIATQRPRVIFHRGWMLARYRDSFYASRAIHILNVLMGNIEIPGGQIIAKGAADCGVQPPRSFTSRVKKPEEKRADGVGWKYRHFDAGVGLFHLFYEAMLTEDPYPIKALICYRHDPLTCFPDPEAQKEALERCELLVAIDTHYSEFAWWSDVILPESTYLERETPVALKKGAKPYLFLRQRAVEPRFNTRANWEIVSMLAERLGLTDFFPFRRIEEIWEWQLEPTGYRTEDFQEKGFIPLTDHPILYPRDQLEGKFKTPSGKIEFVSRKLESLDIPSFKAYQSPSRPPKGRYRLVFGRAPVHTHGHTINNPLLNELMPENTLWINQREAQKLGIEEGDLVDVIAETVKFTVKAHVTEFIHPEAVYTVHGFGREVPYQSRSYKVGLSDQKLMEGLLQHMDPVGGGLCLCEKFVTIRRSPQNPKRRVEL